jgi:hypothetical protein
MYRPQRPSEDRFSGPLNQSGELPGGDIVRLRLEAGLTAEVTLEPAHGFDVGSGPGQPRTATIHGGTAGVILDGRGRSLELPVDRKTCREAVVKWNRALEMYPE